MGFDGFFLGRIDYDDKKHRLQSKRMEMVWRGSESLGSSTDLFTGVLYNVYGPPRGFCFDRACADQPIMVRPENIQKVTAFFCVSAYVHIICVHAH